MRLIGFLIGLGMLAMGFMLGGEAGNMLDLPALVIGVFAALSFTLFGHGNDLWTALTVGFLNRSVKQDTGLHCAKVLNTFRKSLLWTGVAGALIGAVGMSKGMDSWDQFGPAFAVLLLSPFYGVVLAQLVVGPMVDRLEAEHNSRQP